MCNDPTINMRTHLTCTEETHFAFEARRDVFQLIVGRGGQGDGSDGSSVHLHLFDPQIVLPRLAEVVRIGQEAMNGIAVHGRADQVVRWPPLPGPRPQHHAQSTYVQPPQHEDGRGWMDPPSDQEPRHRRD
jgi:hypothetical protein